MYMYICSKKNETDKLHGNRATYLRFCVRAKHKFYHDVVHLLAMFFIL